MPLIITKSICCPKLLPRPGPASRGRSGIDVASSPGALILLNKRASLGADQ